MVWPLWKGADHIGEGSNMDQEHATFTMLKASPQEISSMAIRSEIENLREPYQLYKVVPFDHDGPYPGHLEVAWLPAHRHITLCWDGSADVPRLEHAHKWWGEGAEEADARCLVDGVNEYLNQDDNFTHEAHYVHR